MSLPDCERNHLAIGYINELSAVYANSMRGKLHPHLSWPAAQTAFEKIVQTAISHAAELLCTRVDYALFQEDTMLHMLFCTATRLASGHEPPGFVDEEIEYHATVPELQSGTYTWDDAVGAVTTMLLTAWKEFHDDLTSPESHIWNVPADDSLILASVCGPVPMETILKAFLEHLQPADTSVHYFIDLDSSTILSKTKTVMWQFQHLFLDTFPARFTAIGTGVMVHKAEATERISQMWLCTPTDVQHAFRKLELASAISWPALLSSVIDKLLLVFAPKAPNISQYQAHVLKICSARSAVIRALQGAYRCPDGVYFDFQSPRFNDTISLVTLVLERVLLHSSCTPVPCVKQSFIRSAMLLFPRTLFRYCEMCLRVPGDITAYNIALAAFSEDSASPVQRFLTRAIPKCVRVIDGRESLNLYYLVEEIANLPENLRSDAANTTLCSDTAKVQTAAVQTFAGPFFPMDDSASCRHVSEPLANLREGHTERIRLAFAAVSPQNLILNIMDIWSSPDMCATAVAAHSLIWAASYTARRHLDCLSTLKMTPKKRRTKQRRVMTPTVTCAICFVEHERTPEACIDHPLCVQCLLTSKESMLVDMFRHAKLFSQELIEACSFSGCLHVHSARAWVSYMSSEMRAVLHYLQRPRTDIHCALCNLPVVSTGDDTVARCSACRSATCVQCFGPCHPGTVCSAVFQREGGLTPECVLSEAKLQKCPGCCLPSVKNMGCNHMTCPCGTQWCWLCGEGLSPQNPSAHYSDVVGGVSFSKCRQLEYGIHTEEARIEAAISRRTDISAELKIHCLDLVRGNTRATFHTSVQTAADI